MCHSYNGWLAGYQTVFDSVKSKVTQNNFALGYSKDDIIIHTTVSVVLVFFVVFKTQLPRLLLKQVPRLIYGML